MTEITLGWEEFDIFETILARMGITGGAWKVFGLKGLTPDDVLFLASLRGMVTEEEIAKLYELANARCAV